MLQSNNSKQPGVGNERELTNPLSDAASKQKANTLLVSNIAVPQKLEQLKRKKE